MCSVCMSHRLCMYSSVTDKALAPSHISATACVQRALECSSNREALVRDNATLVVALGALLRIVAFEHLDSKCTRALFALASAAGHAGALDLCAAIWRHVLADLRLWHAAKAEEELRALRQLLNATCAPAASTPGIVSPAHAAASPATILDGLRMLLCADAFPTSAAASVAPPTPPLLRADSSSPSEPSHLAIALLGTLALTPAVGVRSTGGHLLLSAADYCALLATTADCTDDGLLARLLQEVHKTACGTPERSELLRALATQHGGALPFLPLLTRPDVTLRCAALSLIVALAPAAASVAEQMALWRAVSSSLVSSWRLQDGDTRDTLLCLLTGGATRGGSGGVEPLGLRCKELIAPTLRLIAACRDAEHRTAALEGFRNLVEISVDSKKAMLSVQGWYLPLLDVLPKSGGYSSSTSTPSSATPHTGRSSGGVGTGGPQLPQADPLARQLLSSLLVHSVLHCEQGANDVNAVTSGLRRKHAEGELAGDVVLAWVLSVVVQELVNCDPAALNKAMREGGTVAAPKAPAATADDRDEEWLMVLPEHRTANIVAVAAVVHEFLAGLLFLPGLLTSAEEVRPNVEALLWAHKHWMTADPTAMGQSTPGERRECLHPAVWSLFHVVPPKEVAAAVQVPGNGGSGEVVPGPQPLPALPHETWSLLLPPLWKFVVLVMAVMTGSRPADGSGSGPVGGGGVAATVPSPTRGTGAAGGSPGVSMADMPPGEWKVGGGVSSAKALQRDAKEAEGEMISVGRGSLPLRICMIVMLRSLEQPLAAAQKVFKEGGAAAVGLVNRSGPQYFNHVHLFILLLHQAKRARLEAERDAPDGSTRPSATASRRDGDKELSYLVDSFIVQFQTTVAYSLKDSTRVASMLRQPKDVGTVLPNIMPMRAQAAASVELLWRVDSLERRKLTDRSADTIAMQAVAQPAGGIIELAARAETFLTAAAASDAARRAERAAATAASDAAAARRLRDLVRGLTAERQAWAPVDVEGGQGGDEERHEKLANIEDAQRRRVHLKRNRDHQPYDDEDKPSSSVRRTEDDALKELQKLGSRARHTVLPEDVEEDGAEDDGEEGGGADGPDGSGEAESGAEGAADAKEEPLADIQPTLSGAQAAAGGAARVVIDGCVIVTPRGELEGRAVVGGATVAFYATGGVRSWTWCASLVPAQLTHGCMLQVHVCLQDLCDAAKNFRVLACQPTDHSVCLTPPSSVLCLSRLSKQGPGTGHWKMWPRCTMRASSYSSGPSTCTSCPSLATRPPSLPRHPRPTATCSAARSSVVPPMPPSSTAVAPLPLRPLPPSAGHLAT